MSENKKDPTSCNHCGSTNIAKQTWGRTEYWYCHSCKKEPVYVEPKKEDPIPFNPWTPAWDPKQYGFSNASSPDPAVLSDAFIGDYDDTMDLTSLPQGITVDISKIFPGN